MKLNIFSALFYTWLLVLPFLCHQDDCELSKFKRLRKMNIDYVTISNDEIVPVVFYIEETKYIYL